MSYAVHRFSGAQDKEALLAFWNNSHEEHLEERYEWLYENDPAGKAIAFLVKDNAHETYVGCSAAHPRRFSFLGASLRAVIARDFFVHPGHRVLGPALALMKELASTVEEDEADFIYAYPNKQAAQVMKRVGFRFLGSWTRMAKPMGAKRKCHSWNIPRCLSRLMSTVFRVAFWLYAFETWYRFRDGFTFQEIPAFDQRFDALWQESGSRSRVTGERTLDYCTWRFRKCPTKQYTTFAMFDSGGTEPKGYVTTCVDGNDIQIEDFVFPKGRKATRILLAHFLRWARKQSPDSVVVTFLDNEELQELFRQHGFVERPCDRTVWCYFSERMLKTFPGVDDVRNWLLLGSDVHY